MKTILLLSMFLLSCSHSVHLVHLSDTENQKPISSGKKIEATGEQFVILSFVNDTEYVEDARNKLMANCPQGRVSNIMTRYSTSHGFFSWTNKVYMNALCFEN